MSIFYPFLLRFERWSALYRIAKNGKIILDCVQIDNVVQ